MVSTSGASLVATAALDAAHVSLRDRLREASQAISCDCWHGGGQIAAEAVYVQVAREGAKRCDLVFEVAGTRAA
jgi:hypothetical protein